MDFGSARASGPPSSSTTTSSSAPPPPLRSSLLPSLMEGLRTGCALPPRPPPPPMPPPIFPQGTCAVSTCVSVNVFVFPSDVAPLLKPQRMASAPFLRGDWLAVGAGLRPSPLTMSPTHWACLPHWVPVPPSGRSSSTHPQRSSRSILFPRRTTTPHLSSPRQLNMDTDCLSRQKFIPIPILAVVGGTARINRLVARRQGRGRSGGAAGPSAPRLWTTSRPGATSPGTVPFPCPPHSPTRKSVSPRRNPS